MPLELRLNDLLGSTIWAWIGLSVYEQHAEKLPKAVESEAWLKVGDHTANISLKNIGYLRSFVDWCDGVDDVLDFPRLRLFCQQGKSNSPSNRCFASPCLVSDSCDHNALVCADVVQLRMKLLYVIDGDLVAVVLALDYTEDACATNSLEPE